MKVGTKGQIIVIKRIFRGFSIVRLKAAMGYPTVQVRRFMSVEDLYFKLIMCS